jgi:hypothetical protein
MADAEAEPVPVPAEAEPVEAEPAPEPEPEPAPAPDPAAPEPAPQEDEAPQEEQDPALTTEFDVVVLGTGKVPSERQRGFVRLSALTYANPSMFLRTDGVHHEWAYVHRWQEGTAHGQK